MHRFIAEPWAYCHRLWPDDRVDNNYSATAAAQFAGPPPHPGEESPMTRPSVYVTVIRTFFGIVFVGGSVVHLYLGVTSPLSYGPFGDTAWPPLDGLWTGFVMPNIAWLALCMAAFELAVGVTAWLPARWNRMSVIGMTCFFAFLVVLGYAMPTATGLEDFLVNRAGSLVMIALVVPWLMRPQPLSVPGAWSALVRHARHPVRLSAPSATEPRSEPPSSGSTQ